MNETETEGKLIFQQLYWLSEVAQKTLTLLEYKHSFFLSNCYVQIQKVKEWKRESLSFLPLTKKLF
ncbi:hypothetical protein LEP1GSC043_2274 [Leptospira weilii str. Ecochallenge]|uniref:Uncharacterized protein n=2 Tax=Leptospira weilii TaxID=28184 RepID=N1UBN2_9LEPT|nr:hypothetical protein [Leptospira weilii]EMN90986.1 hypothetical protein LEP1GSC108_4258 [Leptospira weilii str. UI 13098]EMY16527.1 hypothetical protein LEP1GSC043_2274 [Leptospira weilii str. Ecochallenge]OMI17287.1 hypothetical protein BUQ74_10935 [Leptospira weilii serovar Heyan]